MSFFIIIKSKVYLLFSIYAYNLHSYLFPAVIIILKYILINEILSIFMKDSYKKVSLCNKPSPGPKSEYIRNVIEAVVMESRYCSFIWLIY